MEQGGMGGVQPGKDFTDHVARLYLQNKMSAKETVVLIEKAYKAGVTEGRGMAAAKGHSWKNTSRNLLRTVLRATDFPELYWAKIPCHNPKTMKDQELVWLPFLLPFELLVRFVSKDKTLLKAACSLEVDSECKVSVDTFCKAHKLPRHETVLLGLHGDG
eukprot:4160964-Lingulodinium_polyedra.AAC.1